MKAKISKNSKKNSKIKNTTKEITIKNSKKKVTKKPTVPKNVCGHSIKLTDEELNQISNVFEAYGSCADLFYERFSSVRYMTDVKSWIDVRNKVR